MSSENMGEIATSSAVLWERQDKESSFMWEFLKGVNQKYGKDLKTYEELHQWSIENVGEFWGDVWAFTGMQHDAPYEKVSGILLWLNYLLVFGILFFASYNMLFLLSCFAREKKCDIWTGLEFI